MKTILLALLILLPAFLMALPVLLPDEPGTDSTSPATRPPRSCIGEVCLADPESPDYQFTHQNYGLKQITHDDNVEIMPWIDGEWVVWTVDPNMMDGRPNDDLYAYNVESEELVPVAVSVDSHAVLPRIAKGLVAFSLWNDESNGIAVWNTTTRLTTLVDHGLEGRAKLSGFDGDWASFFGPRGLWAINIHDGRLAFLYELVPGGQHPNGTYEGIFGSAVTGGKVYYAISYSSEPESNGRSTKFWFDVVEVDLETGERRSFRYDGSAHKIAADGQYVLLESNLEMVVLDVKTGTFFKLTTREEGECGFPSVGQDWASYDCHSNPQHRARGHDISGGWIVHLPTSEKYSIPFESNFFSTVVTDGIGVAFQVKRNNSEVFETLYNDLYYMTVESLLEL